MTNNILISKETREVISKDEMFIGMEGENLQEVLVFNLDEQIEGSAIIEILFPDESTAYIEIEKTEQGYELPVKSSLLTQEGIVKMQLRIIQAGQEIFKSEIIRFKVKESINATTTIPEEYPTWIDNLEALKLNLENAEKERVKAEQGRVDAEKARVETFNQMGQAVDNAIGNIVDLQEAYDKNAEDKIKEFNDNATNQLKAHNTNATNKITEFNNNVTTQTNAFNQNAADKMSDFDKNAQDKLDEYNKNTEVLENRIVELESQVEDLETENENIKNQIPVGEPPAGEYITINDSSDMEFKELRIGGNSWQETRSGKNKLPITKKSTTIDGVEITFNEDKSITLNGTNNGSSNLAIELCSAGELLLSENTAYKLTGKTNVSGIYLQATYYKNGTRAYVTADGEFTTVEANDSLTAGGFGAYAYIRFDVGVTVNNLTIYPMITLASETDTSWEQFGQMPSPEFRSEIRNVGENVNEFDGELELGNITSSGNAENNLQMRSKNYNPIESGAEYIISSPDYEITDANVQIFFYDENKNYISDTWHKVFTTPDNAKYYRFKLLNNLDITLKIKVEKGTATPYSPYNCGNANITVCNGNLLNPEKVVTDSNNAQTYIEDGFIRFKTGPELIVLKPSEIKEKTPYTFKLICKSGVTTTNNIKFVAYYSDGTTESVDNMRNDTNEFTTILKTNKEKTLLYVRCAYSYGLLAYLKIEGSMILEGEYTADNIPDYIEHDSQQFTFPLSEGQRMYKDSYLADDGVHHKRRQTVLGDATSLLANSSAFGTGVSCLYAIYTLPNTKSVSRNYNFLSDRISPAYEVFGQYKGYRNQKTLAVLTTADDTLENFNANIAGSIVEYELENEVIEPYTEEQQKVYNEINKAHSYKNVTHIFSTDETSPINHVIYRKDQETINKNQEERILALENAVLGGN